MTTDQKIILNLFEFFTSVGQQTGELIESENYNAVNHINFDWPNRIYHLNKRRINNHTISDLTHKIANNELPNLLTVPEDQKLQKMLESAGLHILLTQRGMAITLTDPIQESLTSGQQIKRVESKEEVTLFAEIASAGFKYTVNAQIIEILLKNVYRVKLFIGRQDNTFASCGMSFYDSKGNAGLYMIASLPQYRNLGLGRSMTIRLMNECLKENIHLCTLQASAAGEPIYSKLGFKPFNNIYTYKMNG